MLHLLVSQRLQQLQNVLLVQISPFNARFVLNMPMQFGSTIYGRIFPVLTLLLM